MSRYFLLTLGVDWTDEEIEALRRRRAFFQQHHDRAVGFKRELGRYLPKDEMKRLRRSIADSMSHVRASSLVLRIVGPGDWVGAIPTVPAELADYVNLLSPEAVTLNWGVGGRMVTEGSRDG